MNTLSFFIDLIYSLSLVTIYILLLIWALLNALKRLLDKERTAALCIFLLTIMAAHGGWDIVGNIVRSLLPELVR